MKKVCARLANSACDFRQHLWASSPLHNPHSRNPCAESACRAPSKPSSPGNSSRHRPWVIFSLANHLSLKKCKPSGVGTSLASSSWHLLERCDGSLWIPLSSGPSGSACQLENRRAVGGQHLANKFTQGNNGFHVGFP